MANGLNRVMLLGNLGADPEYRMTGGGQSVLNLRIATGETYLDKDRVRQERTEWHTVVVWGKRAEALSKILSKGSQILVEGSLRTTSYNDREGNKRYKTSINAQNIILCGASGKDSAGSKPIAPADPVLSENPMYGAEDYGSVPGDDDIPF